MFPRSGPRVAARRPLNQLVASAFRRKENEDHMNLRTSVLARLVVMGIILLGLLLPLSMVEGVVGERTVRRDSVATDISSTWGGSQVIAGPMLTVPYECTIVENDGKTRQL